MSEDLLNTLKNLKDKLSNLENNYDDKKVEVEKRAKTHESIEKKLETLQAFQNDRIKVEAGGRFYETTKSTIKACIFENILKDQITKEEENGTSFYQTVYYVNNQPVTKEVKYFVDVDKKNFKLILKMLRFFSNTDHQEKFNVWVTDDMDQDYLIKEINYFFKGKDAVFSLIEFKYGIVNEVSLGQVSGGDASRR
jgi:sugar-specific transcriptional regulator TrmB